MTERHTCDRPGTRPSPGPALPVLAAIILLAVTGRPADAQAAPDSAERADSLARQLERLEGRLDSLRRVVAELREPGPDAGEDDLAELRAAARAAADEARGDTARDGGGSRTRSLQALNPEISVTGDFVASRASPASGSGHTSFTPREFEFSFQSALDPYTRTKVFLAREEEFEIAGREEALAGRRPDFLDEGEDGHGEGLDLEEGYLYWVGLPGGLGVKMGKFRQTVGLYNRWHTHALLEADRPLPSQHFLGEHGLIQAGIGLALPSLTTGAGTHDLSFEVARGSNGALFDGGSEPSWLGRLNSFWDLSPSTYLQLGSTAVAGGNDRVAPGVSLDTRLLAFDAMLRWQPSGGSHQRGLRVAAEWYVGEKDYGSTKLSGRGGYLQANYRLDRRWVLGARADWLDGYGGGPNRVLLAPHLSWWQSEWVRLRLQYTYLDRIGGDTDHTLLLQTVWAIGPHKHENY